MALLVVSLAGIAALGYWLGDLVLIAYLFAFMAGLFLSQRHFVERLPWPGLVSPLMVVGWILLAAAIGFAIGGNKPVLYVLAAGVIVGVIQRPFIRFLAWPNLALAFGLTLAGLVGLALDEPYRLLSNDARLWASYLLLLALTAAITYRALMLYTPTALRLSALAVIILLVWLMVYLDQTEQIAQGGVSRYHSHSQQWEQLTLENSAYGRVSCQFFSDSRGRLWAGSGTGLLVSQTNEEERAYLVLDSSALSNMGRQARLSLRSEPMRLIEDRSGRLWVFSSIVFGQFNPDKTEDNLQIYVGDEALASTSAITPTQIVAPLTDVTLDPAGNLWLSTAGAGVLHLDSDQIDNPRWEFFTMGNSNLVSNNIRVIYADRAGQVWAGTSRGLSRFDGAGWQNVAGPEAGADTPVITLLEDSNRQLWVGTAEGGYRWNGPDSIPFFEMAGWPNNTGAEVLFEDSQGGLWAGTAAGALRFDGRQWSNLAPDLHVATFIEGAAGIIWMGGQQGLIRYDLTTKETSAFNAANCGLATDRVWDLYMDQTGRLWVSTFATEEIARSPRGGIWSMVLFFGFLFTNTYRGYRQAHVNVISTLSGKL
jgi:ligand-binding sensor domain-containing protein